MADLSAYRGKASALLAAGVVAIGVIAGANAIVGMRDSAPPAAAAPALPSAPVVPISASVETGLGKTAKTRISGLVRWRPPRLPKPLRLKPIVRHPRKIVTVVSSVAVAAPATPAPSAPVAPTWSKHTTTTTAKQAPLKPTRPAKPVKPVKRVKVPAPKQPPVAPAGTPPPTTVPATAPLPPPTVSTPSQSPAPPTTPTTTTPTTTTTTTTTPTGPTGAVSITGGNVAGRVVTATWAGADPAATTYQWLLCDQDGKTCQPITDATTQTYTLPASDIGLTIRVTAVSGPLSSTSRATDQIERGG